MAAAGDGSMCRGGGVSDHQPRPRTGSVCTGYGGLDLAVELVLGGHLAWYAETDRHARTVCAHHWSHVPNLGDIRAVDWTHVPPVDVLTAGFPCQDISDAGKRAGIAGPHSGLAPHHHSPSRPSTTARVRGKRCRAALTRTRRRPHRPGHARV
ncbi:DNA cytosine methyltransferase [Micromonospora chersina]|uniref:DNA cytosine methyltransferase n=1 Tax=Micromonospora chersina TaxID=47854 RepID=UPI003712B4B8